MSSSFWQYLYKLLCCACSYPQERLSYSVAPALLIVPSFNFLFTAADWFQTSHTRSSLASMKNESLVNLFTLLSQRIFSAKKTFCKVKSTQHHGYHEIHGPRICFAKPLHSEDS